MDYGIQLYSVRDLTGESLEEALQKVSEIGYRFVEFAGFFGHSAEEVADMLARYGLTASGTHTGSGALEQDLEGMTAYHKAIGTNHIIIPGADIYSREKIEEFIKWVNEAIPRLEAMGMTLGYHNHSREFYLTEDGYIPYDELVNRTALKLEIDTYWAYVAGKDPIEMMETYRDRLQFIHIKDGDAEGHGTPLGMGTAPADRVYLKAVELGIPMVVESETLKPDGITEAAICFDFLKKQEAARDGLKS
ncbi:MAG: sugar phosphate isomerase/epimerase [Lachnospiraceae bacterium]|nr:sugar phosphate isomerase/epimerase [Lachnospiraceae bacterium]